MQLLDRLDKRTKMALLDNIPAIIRQDYYSPAVFELNGERWWSTCIGCVEPKCMKYYADEYLCNDIDGFPGEPNDSVCPTDAISWDDEAVRPVINYNKCIECGICAVRCPVGAIYYDENHDAVVISENEKLKKLTITPERIQTQGNSLNTINKIEWKHHFRKEDDIDMDNIYTAVSGFDGRSSVHNVLIRNLLISLGYNCATSRTGDVYTRMDAVYSNGDCKGAVEIEFGKDTLEASRGILDDIASLQTHYGLNKDDNTALVICLSFPNKRQGYFQVIKDIKNVLDQSIQTLSMGALLVLTWNDAKVNFINNDFYADFDNLSIRAALEKYIGRKVNITEGCLGILEPEK